MQILRWILLFPVSIICGYLAYTIGGTVNNFLINLFTGYPPTGLVKTGMDILAYMYLGATTTFAAVKIAPSQSTFVAAGIFVFLLIFAGAAVLPFFTIDKYYAISVIIGLFIGCVAVQVGIFIGEI